MTDHKRYCLIIWMIQVIDNITTISNGHNDDRQVLIYIYENQEICRSSNTSITITPKFKELFLKFRLQKTLYWFDDLVLENINDL